MTVPPPLVTDAISYDDLCTRWERSNWRATEIDLTRDAADWRERLTPEQRRSALCALSPQHRQSALGPEPDLRVVFA